MAVLGPSGSGKTMTLQCIAGLVHPDEGYIRLNDRVLLDSSRGIDVRASARRVGFVFQNYALFPHLTVRQNVAYGIRSLPAAQLNGRVTELLEKMNIPALGNRYPRQLSAGQQQRVAVARALAPGPEILLLDEPFSALDSLVKERLQAELKELQRFYAGEVLFVTHDLGEGYRIGSTMAVFESGRIVQHGAREEVVNHPQSRTVARLVGFRNLFDGSVVEVRQSAVLVRVPALGGTVQAVTSRAVGLKVNQAVTIGIRPQHVQLAPGPGENVIAGTVESVTEGITTTDFRFRLDGSAAGRVGITAALLRPCSAEIVEGYRSFLYLPPDRLAVIIAQR